MKRFTFSLRHLIILTFIAVTWVNFNQERWKAKNVIVQDVANYYSYLPALFYERDLSLAFLNDSLNRDVEVMLYTPNNTPEGKPVVKMSMGMAMSYLPFFGVAHLCARWFDYPRDGFSEPYQAAILFSSLFYYLLGFVFCGKLLRFYFPERIVVLSLFCITFATHVFYYLTIGGGMAHTVGFAGVAIFLYLTVQWYRQQRLIIAMGLGIVAGLLLMVRPVNGLVVIFFILYPVYPSKDFAERIKYWWLYKWQIAMMVLCAFLVVLPQLLYWKYVTGGFMFNSYVGEHFYFNRPHILKALFGFRKGWLIYTPILTLVFAGLFFMRGLLRPLFLPILVFFLVYIYVAFSWWCWWYGGSFGQRALIDIYPLLTLPFGACLLMLQTTRRRRYFSGALIICFTALNLFETIQAKYNIIHYDSMTASSYRQAFFAITKPTDREKHLQHPDYDKARAGQEE